MLRIHGRASRVAASAFLVGAALVSGARAGSIDDAVLKVPGGSGGEQMGIAVAAVGDVDGDGTPDFVVGADQASYALVCSGADGSTIHTLKGSGSDGFGYAVAGPGDADGDGVDDILVGAPYEYNGKSQTGAAHLFSGKDGSTLQTFYGDTQGDLFGSSVAGIGDIDGDGVADLIVGAPAAYDPFTTGATTGMVKVFLGGGWKNLYSIYGDYGGDDFGVSVCGTGNDVDGDGVPDFAVGADYGQDGNGRTPGYVRVFSGSSSKQVTTLYGAYDNDTFGTSVAPAGDVDGDGTDDLLVGSAYGQDTNGNIPGTVDVYSGSNWKIVHTVHGDSDKSLFGRSVSGGLDMDGDGVPDFVVGAFNMTDAGGVYAGAARTFSGADASELDTIFGAAADDQFGWSVALLPDVTGDDLADFVVGGPYDDAGTTDAGTAYVFGAAGGATPSGTILIDGDAVATASADVTLSFTWKDAGASVTEMRLRDSGGDWSDWMAVAESADWTLPGGDGEKTVEVQFRDEGSVESDVVGDSIVFDTEAPTGAVLVEGGADWVSSLEVSLALNYADTGSGVTEVRVRNAGDEFGEWFQADPILGWTLAGAGQNTVEVQLRDAAGNESAVASDSIGADLQAPTGSIAIENGAAVVRTTNVTVKLTAADTGGSGVSQVRLRRTGVPEWGVWQAFAANVGFSLPTGDGPKSLDAQFRDVAGNESDVYADTVVLDENRPFVVTFKLHEPRPFFLPQEAIGFDLAATDSAGGSGVDSARTSWDGGLTWSPWSDITGGGVYTPARPPTLAGAANARVVVRDFAGNESNASAPVPVFLVGADSPRLGSGGKSLGSLSGLDDVDVVDIDLVKGDTLNVTLKGRPSVRKQSFVLAVDLARADGQRLVEGRYPDTLKAAGIKGFVAPETGRYLLVVRHADAEGDPAGTYTLRMTVRHAKANAAGRGTAEAGEFTFDAAAGSKFSGTLKGDGLDPESVTVEGPDGPVEVHATLRRGKVSIAPVQLTEGTGPYTVRFTATGPVAFTWKATLPKPNVKLTEE